VSDGRATIACIENGALGLRELAGYECCDFVLGSCHVERPFSKYMRAHTTG